MAQLWMFGLPSDRITALKLLKELGCSTVTVGKDEEAVKAITDEGMKAHVVMGAFSFERADLRKRDSLVRRLDGKRVEWFGSGCPNNPKIRKVSLSRARDAASVEGVEAVVLDGIRFASPGEGIDTFLSCFCDVCKRKSDELGYDMREMKASLRDLVKSIGHLTPSLLNSVGGWKSPVDMLDLLLRFPGMLEWLRFRADCVCEHITDIRKAIRSANPRCKLGAYLFTPSLSYLVGQDYRRLEELLDYVEPMIYRTGEGVACLNHEVAKMAADIYEMGDGLDQVEIQRFPLQPPRSGCGTGDQHQPPQGGHILQVGRIRGAKGREDCRSFEARSDPSPGRSILEGKRGGCPESRHQGDLIFPLPRGRGKGH